MVKDYKMIDLPVRLFMWEEKKSLKQIIAFATSHKNFGFSSKATNDAFSDILGRHSILRNFAKLTTIVSLTSPWSNKHKSKNEYFITDLCQQVASCFWVILFL